MRFWGTWASPATRSIVTSTPFAGSFVTAQITHAMWRPFAARGSVSGLARRIDYQRAARHLHHGVINRIRDEPRNNWSPRSPSRPIDWTSVDRPALKTVMSEIIPETGPRDRAARSMHECPAHERHTRVPVPARSRGAARPLAAGRMAAIGPSIACGSTLSARRFSRATGRGLLMRRFLAATTVA